ncbi:MAG: tetratricopeptide repeat protein [Actinomycetia bacterium]|nr:tetratricopeptide repeat protein [Actinomycetes bacterium]
MILDKKKASLPIKIIAALIVIAFILSVVMMVIPSLTWKGALTQPEAKMTQEEKYFSDGVTMFSSKVEVDDQDVESWVSLGNYYFDWGAYKAQQNDLEAVGEKLRQAIIAYQKSLELDPENYDVRTDLATVFFYTGNSTAAIAGYQEVLQNVPTHPNAQFNLGNVYSQTGKKNEAIKAWEDFLHLVPTGETADLVRSRIAELSNQTAP